MRVSEQRGGSSCWRGVSLSDARRFCAGRLFSRHVFFSLNPPRGCAAVLLHSNLLWQDAAGVRRGSVASCGSVRDRLWWQQSPLFRLRYPRRGWDGGFWFQRLRIHQDGPDSGILGDLRHHGGSRPSGKSNHQVGFSFIQHLLVSEVTGAPAESIPLSGVSLALHTSAFRPVRGQGIRASRIAVNHHRWLHSIQHAVYPFPVTVIASSADQNP